MSDHMQHALELAKRGLGNVWPNPAVGAVIVKDGIIIGCGWTQPGGRPHAEAMALAQAGDAARGATMYVTLEPCCQPGRGPACTDNIIAAGIKKVVIAMLDPHQKVNGQGIVALRAAGIEVEVGECEAHARELNKGFLSVVERGRPMVTLKLAVSANHKLSTGDAKNPWITGEAARRHGHLLRATHDAILVGVGTVIADDPMLDCRIPGLEKFSPVRVVLDRRGQMPLDSKLEKTKNQIPLWVMAHKNLNDALKELATKGITRVLVEGGAAVAKSFIAENLVDEWALYRSPNNAPDAGVNAPMPGLEFHVVEERPLGEDTYVRWVKS
jgi:diaminohydroxyphosphoribosylaminopyrimidine deaminase/5-amino-6-(5-phosphoribosylamino)uracil reductase